MIKKICYTSISQDGSEGQVMERNGYWHEEAFGFVDRGDAACI